MRSRAVPRAARRKRTTLASCSALAAAATAGSASAQAPDRILFNANNVDPVTGATVVTEERTVPPLPLTGTKAERRYMERKWCEKLWRAMPRVQRRKSLDVARVLERAAKR